MKPPFTTRPELTGTFGAVASTHWIATSVGMSMLEAGGNAFDAAAAAGFVLQIVEPHLSGPGGDAPILACRHDDSEPTVICGQGPAPAKATIAEFKLLGLDLIPGTGLLAACVPGAFGAWMTMLRDWGTMSVRDILGPAIGYARDGHPILGSAVNVIHSVKELFRDEWPSSAAVFLPDGKAPVPGKLFKNPAIASLYSRIVDVAEAAKGDREASIDAVLAYWYDGAVAEAIGRHCRDTEAMDVSGQRHKGLLSARDMRGWRPPIERPLSVDYRGYRIFKCGAWSLGPAMLQALQILSGFDLSKYRADDPAFVHLVTETLKLVMADCDAWYGDDPDVPIDALLSADYAAERRDLIGREASRDLRPGKPAGRTPRLPKLNDAILPATAGGSGEPTVGIKGAEPTVAWPTGLPPSPPRQAIHVIST